MSAKGGLYYFSLCTFNFTLLMFPLSLATTNGISSIRQRRTELIYFPHATEMFHFAWFPLSTSHDVKACTLPVHRFPHSDTPGSKLVCQLPEAFRRLLRPSSAHIAKASTIYPYIVLTLSVLHTETQTYAD